MSRTVCAVALGVALVLGFQTTALAAPPKPIPELPQYSTTPASEPGMAYPDATDPTAALPRAIQVEAQCVRYNESRNKPHDPGQDFGGWYQIELPEWQYAATILGIKAPKAGLATPDQQSAVFVFYFRRNGHLAPEWRDGCGP